MISGESLAWLGEAKGRRGCSQLHQALGLLKRTLPAEVAGGLQDTRAHEEKHFM